MDRETTLGDFLDPDAIRLVLIHDEWVGLSEFSPVRASYELRRGVRGGLAGEGMLSASMASRRVDVALTRGATKELLDMLASAVLLDAPYKPRHEWTDDYPHIQIVLHARGSSKPYRSEGVALLFTESQGEFHAPWGAFVDGRSWTVQGDGIGRALAALHKPLRRATLERMMR